jgi:hypothetical protein
VNIYVNDEDIRYLSNEQTPVGDKDTVSIVPSVACGSTATVDTHALPELTSEEVRRYSRHLIMPEVGVEGQRKLKAAKVLCIGAGGLGSPAAMYLAAAGIGTLGIVDFDTVDFSNLQRQVLYSTDDVGRPKAKAATTGSRAESKHQGRPSRVRAQFDERARALSPIRHHRRRGGQFPHPIPRQRRMRAERQAKRLRQHLPIRWTGLDLRDEERPVLPLPVSGTTASGTCPELRGGWCARCAARRGRHDPGDGSDQAHHRRGRAVDRPPDAVRRAPDEVPRAQASEGS